MWKIILRLELFSKFVFFSKVFCFSNAQNNFYFIWNSSRLNFTEFCYLPELSSQFVYYSGCESVESLIEVDVVDACTNKRYRTMTTLTLLFFFRTIISVIIFSIEMSKLYTAISIHRVVLNGMVNLRNLKLKKSSPSLLNWILNSKSFIFFPSSRS